MSSDTEQFLRDLGIEDTQTDIGAMEASIAERTRKMMEEIVQGSHTLDETTALLGISTSTVMYRLRVGEILGGHYQGVSYFPKWQFQDGKIAKNLEPVLQALSAPHYMRSVPTGIGKIRWLTLPNPYLDGETPLSLIGKGELNRVVEEARGIGYAL
jgi:hypothetical protein